MTEDDTFRVLARKPALEILNEWIYCQERLNALTNHHVTLPEFHAIRGKWLRERGWPEEEWNIEIGRTE